MQVSTLTDFKKKFNIDTVNFPFFYLDDYAGFLEKSEEKTTGLMHADNGDSIVYKIWKNKFIEILQPMYPPLDKDGDRLTEKEEKEFLNKFVDYIHDQNIAQRITQPENFAIFKSVPTDATAAVFGTYFLDLKNNTEDQLFRNLHSKNRNVIRNAEKGHAQIRYGKEVLADFYMLYQQTMLRSNMYCQEHDHFIKLFEALPGNIICGVVYDKGVPQGGLFIPYTNFGAFYLYGASAENITLNGSINYLHWNTIKMLKNKGVKRYDFVGARLSDVSGTKLEGIQQFKERFGSQLETGFLWKMNVNKFDCLVFDLLILLKHKVNKLIPPVDIIDEENHKILQQLKEGASPSIGKKVSKKISQKKHTVNKRLRGLQKVIDKKSLIKDLEEAGIKPKDTILVHSSLSKIGNVGGGAKTVIEALLDRVGKEGNVIMPSYSYIDSMENTAKSPDYIFDPLISPSKVGIITEEFRRWPHAVRSLHPTHSVSAIGPKAAYLTEGHLNSNTNFGPNTPFHRIRENNGKIVGLGISLGPVTIYHTLEDFYPELFKGVYLPEQAPIKLRHEGKEIRKKVSIHNPQFHTDRIDKNHSIESWMHRHFKAKGILHEGSFGRGAIWWMDIQELFDELLALRRKKITIYKVPKK